MAGAPARLRSAVGRTEAKRPCMRNALAGLRGELALLANTARNGDGGHVADWFKRRLPKEASARHEEHCDDSL